MSLKGPTMRMLIISLISLYVCITAHAQELKSKAPSDIGEQPNLLARHLIQIDLVPTLVSAISASKPGGGLMYHFRLSKHFGVGAFADLMTMGSEEGILFYKDLEIERMKYGLEARGYLSRFGQGFYGAVGSAFTNVKLSAQARPMNFQEFGVSDRANQNGFISRVGYTFGRRSERNAIILDLALEYGPANRVAYRGTTGGVFRITEVENDFTLNAGVGARF